MRDASVIRSHQMQKRVRVGEVPLLVSVQPPPWSRRIEESPSTPTMQSRQSRDPGLESDLETQRAASLWRVGQGLPLNPELVFIACSPDAFRRVLLLPSILAPLTALAANRT